MKRKIGFIPLLVCLLALSQQVKAHHDNLALSGFGTPSIDGVLESDEWAPADSVSFDVTIPGGKTVPGTLSVMNDFQNLYIAISFPYTARGNSASIRFDNDHSATELETGDDALIINPAIGFLDECHTTEPPCPSGKLCCLRDTDLGGSNDGEGAFSNESGITVYEFSHPFDSTDDAHDINSRFGDVLGFNIEVRLIDPPSVWPEDFGDTSFPAAAPGATWDYGDIRIALPGGCSISGKSKNFSCLTAGCGFFFMVLAWNYIRKKGGSRKKSWK